FELLESLVEKHATTGYGGRIDWVRVGRELGRSANAFQSLKKGPFSPEEDAIILARVAAWDMNEKGLWTGLERELGRSTSNIQTRWERTLSMISESAMEGSGSKEERREERRRQKRERKVKAREGEAEAEAETEVTRMETGKEEGRKEKRQKVEASSSSSSSRSADAGAEAGKTGKSGEKVKGEKGEVEVQGETEEGEEGEEGGGGGEGDAEPSRARAKDSSGQRKACSSTAEGPVKKGPFSPKEDAIILARVAAWDMNEQGLWIALERELGRAASKILARWTHIISMIRESAIEEIGSKEERRRLDWERKTAKATKAREEEEEAEAEALVRVDTEKEEGREGKRQKVEASSSSSRSAGGAGAGAGADAGAGAGAVEAAVRAVTLVEGDLSRKGPRSLFKGWLKSRQMRLKKLTEQEKGEQFRKFVKMFNKHKLPDSYYLPGAEEAGAGEGVEADGETGENEVKKEKGEVKGEKEKGEKGKVEIKGETEEGEEGGGGGEGDAKPSRARVKDSSGQRKARTPRAEGYSSGGVFGFIYWTKEMDARLLEGVELFGFGHGQWNRVAAHELYNGPWTDEEFELLKSLVEKHSTGREGRIDWAPKGPYSPKEDAIILARVAAWDTNEQGLWAGLETELGRRASNIQTRWERTLSKR
ncbi:hypothetical protein B484DRAFT_390936, partial [Ochromonadaceae sp. CCMP2298]